MTKYFDTIIIFLLIILINSCTTNKYFQSKIKYSLEGEWLLNKDPNKKLVISEIEENLYSLIFYSKLDDWEAIGYKIEDELLTIFKYKKLNQKGYITFKLLEKNRIYYESLNTNGEIRSSGNYYKVKSP